MSQSFNCPNCNAPLDFDGDDVTVRCPYCNSSVIVPGQRVAAPSIPARSPSLPVVGLDALISQADKLKEIAHLIRSDNRIEAIQLYQETFKTSLIEAQAAVEKLAAGQSIVMPVSTPAAHTDLERQLSRLLKMGKKIEAIKLYRQVTGAGLKEAKDAVEKYDSTGLLDMPDATITANETVSVPSGLSSNRVAVARADIARLMRAGKKIEAIKLYRQITGAGLKESKDAVEAFEAGQPLVFVANPKPDADDSAAPMGLSPSTRSGLSLRYPFLLFCGLFALLFFFLTIFVWPNNLRLGAPFLCPTGYDNAYGLRSDGFVALHCYIEPNRDVIANAPIALGAVFVFYFLFGVFLFGMLKYIRFAGFSLALIMLLPFATLSFPLIAWATAAEAPREMFTLGLLFADTDGRRVVPSQTEQLLSRLTFNFATPTLYIGAEGTRPGYFENLQGVAVDGAGNIYAADRIESGLSQMQVYDSTGHLLNEWTLGTIYLDGFVADPSGHLYVASTDGLSVYTGQSGELIKTLNPDENYNDVAFDPNGNLVTVTEDRLQWLTTDGRLVNQSESFKELIGGNLSSAQIAVGPDGNVYVPDPDHFQILVFSKEGQLLTRFGSQGDADDQFLFGPRVLAVDGQNRLFVSTGRDLKQFDSSGNFIANIGLSVGAQNFFFTPQGDLWVVNGYSVQVVKFRVNQ